VAYIFSKFLKMYQRIKIPSHFSFQKKMYQMFKVRSPSFYTTLSRKIIQFLIYFRPKNYLILLVFYKGEINLKCITCIRINFTNFSDMYERREGHIFLSFFIFLLSFLYLFRKTNIFNITLKILLY
jgi:hypothetical protein